MRLHVIALATVLLTASSAQAAGFLLRNHGARASGRANTFVADPQDASAVFHNPAGLTNLDGIQFSVGGNLIVPETTFTPNEGGDQAELQVNSIFTPYAYASFEFSPYITFGIGVNPPYGSGLEWDENSPGRDIVREIQLRTWYIMPTVAVDFDELGLPGFSFAAGLDLAPASAYLARDVLVGDQVGTVELSGSDFGFGGRAGLTYNPSFAEDLNFGVSFRLPIAFNFEGEGDFDFEDPALRQSLNPDGDGNVELEVPATLSFGIAYNFLENFQVEVDVDWVGWDVYDELVLLLPSFPETPEVREELILERNWESTWGFRIGAEYGEDDWAVRVGYAYDPTPVPPETLDFTLPDVDRHVLTAGASFALTDNISIDGAFWYLVTGTQDTSTEPFTPPNQGEYELGAFVASLGLNVAFGAPPNPYLPGGPKDPNQGEGTVEPVAENEPLPRQRTVAATLR